MMVVRDEGGVPQEIIDSESPPSAQWHIALAPHSGSFRRTPAHIAIGQRNPQMKGAGDPSDKSKVSQEVGGEQLLCSFRYHILYIPTRRVSIP